MKKMKKMKQIAMVSLALVTVVISGILFSACGGNHTPAVGDIYKGTEYKLTIAEADQTTYNTLFTALGKTQAEYEAYMLEKSAKNRIKFIEGNKVVSIDDEGNVQLSIETEYTIEGDKLSYTIMGETVTATISGNTLVVKQTMANSESYATLTYTLQ